jgi:hypothetical protein
MRDVHSLNKHLIALQIGEVSGEIVPKKLGMTSPGEVVPRYDFSWRSRIWVQFLQQKSYSSILEYEFSYRICTHQILGMTFPGEKLPHFSNKILGTTSEKKLCHFQF